MVLPPAHIRMVPTGICSVVANIERVTLFAPIVVALPTLVTSPVKFALVVTVAALPVVFWLRVGTSPALIV